MEPCLLSYSKEHVACFIKEHYGIEGNLTVLYGFCDHNYQLTTSKSTQNYVVKIASDLQNPTLMKIQNILLAQLQNHPLAQCKTPQLVPSLKGQIMIPVTVQNRTNHCRVFKFIEGTLMSEIQPFSMTTQVQAVRYIAELTLRLQQSTQLPEVQALLAVESGQKSNINLANFNAFYHSRSKYVRQDLKQMISSVFEEYQIVLPILKETPKHLIHNDAVPHNILVGKQGDQLNVTGIIDFGDVLLSHRIAELAVYLVKVMDFNSPVEHMVALIKEWNKVCPLTKQEIQIILPMAKTRLALILVYFCYLEVQRPQNKAAYASIPYEVQALTTLMKVDSKQFEQVLKEALN